MASKAKSSKSEHPSYLVMVKEAVTALADRKGSTPQKIKKYISGIYIIEINAGFNKRVNAALKKALVDKILKRPAPGSEHNVSAIGLFKLGDVPADKLKAKPKKVVVKKATTKKVAIKRTPAKKTVKSPGKKSTTKPKATEKATGVKKTSKKGPAKKSPAKKSTIAKKPIAKKTPAKKTPAKKTPAKTSSKK